MALSFRNFVEKIRSIFFIILICFFSWLPIVIIDFFLKIILRPSLIQRTKEGKRLFLNIKKIYNLPSHTSFAKRFAIENLRTLLLINIETFREFTRKSQVHIEGLDELKENMKKAENDPGKGNIIITGHIGSWELAGKCCSDSTKKNFYALAKPSKFKFINTFLQKLREYFNIKVLWTGKSNFQREILQVLKSDQWLGILMDQKPVNRRGPVVNFFNEPTEFVSGPASLALKYNSSIVAVFCVRKAAFHYVLKSKYIGYASQYEHMGVSGLTQVLATEIEEIVKIYPEQWPWAYKRWKR